MKNITFILILCAALMSFAIRAKAQDGTETITYTFERNEVAGEGWYFVQTTTTRRPDSSIVVNTVQTYRATETEIDSFISAYKRGLDQDFLRAEAVFNDLKAKKEAAAPVGPAVIFFRTGDVEKFRSGITLPDNTVKPEKGSVWQYDGTGYVPYICPSTKRKAPVKTPSKQKKQ